MKLKNVEFAKFAIEKVGTPYVMGTNGKVLDNNTFNKLIKLNPNKWFSPTRINKARKFIGKKTTDCHGLMEWFYRECTGKEKDITANMSIEQSDFKGNINYLMPDIPGTCVWKPGHFGVYIGSGYVVEAKGIDYGTCITKLSDTKWEKWFYHPWVDNSENGLPKPTASKISKASPFYDIVWLQLNLNRQIEAGHIAGPLLVVDGNYGEKTKNAVKRYWKYMKWKDESDGSAVGKTTIKYLNFAIFN